MDVGDPVSINNVIICNTVFHATLVSILRIRVLK